MRIVIIRFSSIGDVLQTLSAVSLVHKEFPGAEIHVATQSRFLEFFSTHPGVQKIWTVPQKSGPKELWKLAGEMSKSGFTHVYDAHNNLRSRLLVWMLRLHGRRFKFVRRPVYRFKRFLLFKFRINLFPQPFSGQMDQLRPLRKWGIKPMILDEPKLFIPDEVMAQVKSRFERLGLKSFIGLVPSAAYELKRWPKEYWVELIRSQPRHRFALLGGPEDLFLKDIAAPFPDRVVNLAGELSLMESAAAVKLSEAIVSNDTGVMHMAEQMGKNCVALMGPAPFGFPSQPTTKVLERKLWCRPCSKHGQGPCINKEFHKCMRDIAPAEVGRTLEKFSGAF